MKYYLIYSGKGCINCYDFKRDNNNKLTKRLVKLHPAEPYEIDSDVVDIPDVSAYYKQMKSLGIRLVSETETNNEEVVTDNDNSNLPNDSIDNNEINDTGEDNESINTEEDESVESNSESEYVIDDSDNEVEDNTDNNANNEDDIENTADNSELISYLDSTYESVDELKALADNLGVSYKKRGLNKEYLINKIISDASDKVIDLMQ